MPVNCGLCSVNISRTTGESCIICNSCSKCFHLKCGNVDIKDLSAIKSTWMCSTCKMAAVFSTLKTMESDLSAFKNNTNSAITNITESTKTLMNLSSVVMENSNRIGILEVENRAMKSEVDKLKNQISKIESVSRKNNLVISGIPEKSKENLVEIIIKLANSLNINISNENIDKATRFRPRNGSLKPILVIFTQSMYRDRILSFYNLHKNICGTAIGMPDNIIIRIGEHLSISKQSLLQKVKKELKSSGLYKYVWSQNGNILIRKTSVSKILKLRTDDDISRYKSIQTDSNLI